MSEHHGVFRSRIDQTNLLIRPFQKFNEHCSPRDDDFMGFADEWLFITDGSILILRSFDISNCDREASTYASMTERA